jgi:FkbM family methyltransferase
MFKKLLSLKTNHNYCPEIIFDIGACYGNWTHQMLHTYPNAEYFLFEAINYSQLNQFSSNPKIHVHNVILNDKIEEVSWYEKQNTGDSFFKEKTHHFIDVIPLKKQTIDLNSYLDKIKFSLHHSKNIFIKIDCQGAEISILKGASSILSSVNFILIEMPLFGQYNENVPNFLHHVQFMDEIGFIPFDIIDNHYINNFNMQIDFLFINKNHALNQKVQSNLLS